MSETLQLSHGRCTAGALARRIARLVGTRPHRPPASLPRRLRPRSQDGGRRRIGRERAQDRAGAAQTLPRCCARPDWDALGACAETGASCGGARRGLRQPGRQNGGEKWQAIERKCWQLWVSLMIGMIVLLALRGGNSGGVETTPEADVTATLPGGITPTPLALEAQDEVIQGGDTSRAPFYPINLQITVPDETRAARLGRAASGGAGIGMELRLEPGHRLLPERDECASGDRHSVVGGQCGVVRTNWRRDRVQFADEHRCDPDLHFRGQA